MLSRLGHLKGRRSIPFASFSQLLLLMILFQLTDETFVWANLHQCVLTIFLRLLTL